MKKYLLTLILITAPQIGSAADSTAAPRSEDTPRAASGSNTRITSAWASGSNDVPDMSNLDDFYKKGSHKAFCPASWDKFKKIDVHHEDVQAPLETFRASAQQAGISQTKIDAALKAYAKNQDKIPNQKYISLVDFDKPGDQPRWFFFDLSSGKIAGAFKVSAGYGSTSPKAFRTDHIADKFTDEKNSNASSLGCAVSAEHYTGMAGDSIRLHGFDIGKNSNSCDRSVVIHSTTTWARPFPAGTGRTDGCLGIDPTRDVYKLLGQGGLICSYKEGAHTESGFYGKARRSRRGSYSSHHSGRRYRRRRQRVQYY